MAHGFAPGDLETVVIAGMTFVVQAGMLSGEFYVSAAAMFLTTIPMALFPDWLPWLDKQAAVREAGRMIVASGAATNAVELAEVLLARGWVDPATARGASPYRARGSEVAVGGGTA